MKRRKPANIFSCDMCDNPGVYLAAWVSAVDPMDYYAVRMCGECQRSKEIRQLIKGVIGASNGFPA